MSLLFLRLGEVTRKTICDRRQDIDVTKIKPTELQKKSQGNNSEKPKQN